MKKYRGIIFDLDGTLLNTLEDLTHAVNYTMTRYQVEAKSFEEVRRYLGNGVRNLLELCVPEAVGEKKFDSMVDTFVTYYEANCNHFTRPYDHITDLLETLKIENYQLAIVSNKIDSAVKALNEMFFNSWIKIAIGEREGTRRKPNADMVTICLKQMGLSPSEVVYIGDSEVDILTAKNAGIDCICVEWGFRDKSWLLSQGAECVVSDVKQLEKMFLD